LKSVLAFTTTRRDGNARHPPRLNRILVSKGLPRSIATGEQVHGVRLAVVPKQQRARKWAGVDGLLTAAPGQPLGIFTADCAAVFLYFPSQGVIGLLHAGWRGVRGNIPRKALVLARRRWGCRPGDAQLWLGPCIGPCCFEARWDVARFFPATRRRRGSSWTVNLAEEIRRQARRSGVKGIRKQHLLCTRHGSAYFSFRRDQTDHRQISVLTKS
jgi:YfiH family protein